MSKDKSEAEKAREVLLKERKERVEKCQQELAELLKKHNCRLEEVRQIAVIPNE